MPLLGTALRIAILFGLVFHGSLADSDEPEKQIPTRTRFTVDGRDLFVVISPQRIKETGKCQPESVALEKSIVKITAASRNQLAKLCRQPDSWNLISCALTRYDENYWYWECTYLNGDTEYVGLVVYLDGTPAEVTRTIESP